MALGLGIGSNGGGGGVTSLVGDAVLTIGGRVKSTAKVGDTAALRLALLGTTAPSAATWFAAGTTTGIAFVNGAAVPAGLGGLSAVDVRGTGTDGLGYVSNAVNVAAVVLGLASLSEARVGGVMTVSDPDPSSIYLLSGRRPGSSEWHLLSPFGVGSPVTLDYICTGLEVCVEQYDMSALVTNRSETFGPILHAVDVVGTTVTTQAEFNAAKGSASKIILAGDWSTVTLDATGITKTSGTRLTITQDISNPTVLGGIDFGTSSYIDVVGVDMYRDHVTCMAGNIDFVSMSGGDRHIRFIGCKARGEIAPSSLYNDRTYRSAFGIVVGPITGTVTVGETVTHGVSGVLGVVSAVYAQRPGLPGTIIAFDEAGRTDAQLSAAETAFPLTGSISFSGGATASQLCKSGRANWLPRLMSNSDARFVTVDGCLFESVFTFGDYSSATTVTNNVGVGYWFDGFRFVSRAGSLASDRIVNTGNIVSRCLSIYEEGTGKIPHPDASQYFIDIPSYVDDGVSGYFNDMKFENNILCSGDNRSLESNGPKNLIIINANMRGTSYRNCVADTDAVGPAFYASNEKEGLVSRLSLYGGAARLDSKSGWHFLTNSLVSNTLDVDGSTEGGFVEVYNTLSNSLGLFPNRVRRPNTPQEMLILDVPALANADKSAIAAPGYLIPATGVRPAAPTVSPTAVPSGIDLTMTAGFAEYFMRYRIVGAATWNVVRNSTGVFAVRSLPTGSYEVNGSVRSGELHSKVSANAAVTIATSAAPVATVGGVPQPVDGLVTVTDLGGGTYRMRSTAVNNTTVRAAIAVDTSVHGTSLRIKGTVNGVNTSTGKTAIVRRATTNNGAGTNLASVSTSGANPLVDFGAGTAFTASSATLIYIQVIIASANNGDTLDFNLPIEVV